ncbi:MAG TPA: NAD(+)/NADH kinase [Solirubrobacterales bacterium]|nr:NAD(+)/NADH kinase [Solirubrobacterales bacterium]
MRLVSVLTHTGPSNTKEAVRATAAAATDAGCELVVVEREPERDADLEPIEGVRLASELPAEAELCLALGGDGTILRALRRYAGAAVPVFGINYGTVGFLAAAEGDELATAVRRALAGEFETITMPGLEVEIDGQRQIAVNDVSFARRPHQRVAELSYSVSGREVGRVRCDGLVAATPAGSTGYNLANNGPILAWGVEGYVVSFIAPHTLTARALVVAPDDVLHVANVGQRDSVDIGLDGIESGTLSPGEELTVGFRDNLALLAQFEGETFYGRVREKFGRLAH